MSVISGLDEITKYIEDKSTSRVDINRAFKLQPGKSRKIRFVQELDKKAKNYDEKYGTGLVVSERVHPDADTFPGGKLFWLKLVDRYDEEGQDWAAEQGWAPKTTVYINCVDIDTGEVLLFERSAFSALTDSVLQTAKARGTITESVFSLSRGPGEKGQYALTVVDIAEGVVEVDPDDLYDLNEDVLRNIPYEEQEAYVREIEARVKKNDAADSEDDGETSDEVWG